MNPLLMYLLLREMEPSKSIEVPRWVIPVLLVLLVGLFIIFCGFIYNVILFNF